MSESILNKCLQELQEMSKEEVVRKCKELDLYSDKYDNDNYKDDMFKLFERDDLSG